MSTTAAPVAGSRPGDTRWLATREFRYWLTNYRRTWRGSIVTSVLTPVLYLTAMGIGLGTLVNRNGAHQLHGTSYLAFIAPGLLAATAMQTAIVESSYPVLGSVKWKRNYLAAVTTPLPASSVAAGHLLFIAFRIGSSCAAYLIVMAAFGTISSPLALLALPAALLTGMAFAAPVLAWAVTRRRDSGFSVLTRFVMIPLTLFSATFFPIGQLPGWLRPVAYVTPLWHGVDLCRGLVLGGVSAGAAAVHCAYLLALTVAGVAAARVTYRRRLYL